MFRLTEISPVLQKCLDDPAFIRLFCDTLRAAHPEFRAISDRMRPEEFAFVTRKCITTSTLCAGGASKTKGMLERLQRCETEAWGRRDLFPLWIDCLIRTVDDLYPLSGSLRNAWRKALVGCATLL